MVLLTGSDVLGQPRGLATKSAFGLLFPAFIALSDYSRSPVKVDKTKF